MKQKPKKNFIDWHPWKAQGCSGHRNGWIQRLKSYHPHLAPFSPIREYSQLTLLPLPAMKWPPLALGLHHLLAKRKPLLSTCFTQRCGLVSHWPGLGYAAMLVKSVCSILLATVVMPMPRAGPWVSPSRATQSECGRGDSSKSNQCAVTGGKKKKHEILSQQK